jgi:hypothetical protein
MDDSLKLFREYFRDIYTASSGTCAGICDKATPASLGPSAYEIRRCCKNACSDSGIDSLEQCRTQFCMSKCNSETLVTQMEIVNDCVSVCQLGCDHRFQTQSR